MVTEITRNPNRVLWPLGLSTALSLMGDATIYTVLPTHTQDAGIELAQVGVMLSANRIIRVFLNGPAGMFYNRVPRRLLYTASVFLGAFSTLLYALSNGFWPLLLARLLWGISWVGIWVGGNIMILDIAGEDDRGKWSGLYMMWFFLGAMVCRLAGGLMTDMIGYRNAMYVGAVVTALSAFAPLLSLPETRNWHPAPEKLAPDPKALAATWWRRPGIIGVVAMTWIIRFVFGGVVGATLALLMQERLGNTVEIGTATIGVATVTGIVSAFMTGTSMLSSPVMGDASDKFGRWRAALVATLIGGVGVALLAFGSPPILVVAIAMNAISSGGLSAIRTAIAGDLAGDSHKGHLVGLVQTVGDGASGIAPLVGYALLPTVGLAGVYLLCLVFFALTVLTIWPHATGEFMGRAAGS